VARIAPLGFALLLIGCGALGLAIASSVREGSATWLLGLGIIAIPYGFVALRQLWKDRL